MVEAIHRSGVAVDEESVIHPTTSPRTGRYLAGWIVEAIRRDGVAVDEESVIKPREQAGIS